MNIAVALNGVVIPPSLAELSRAAFWAASESNLYLALSLTSTKWALPVPNITLSSLRMSARNGWPNDVSGELKICLYLFSSLKPSSSVVPPQSAPDLTCRILLIWASAQLAVHITAVSATTSTISAVSPTLRVVGPKNLSS